MCQDDAVRNPYHVNQLELRDDLDLTQPERLIWQAATNGKAVVFGGGDPRDLSSPTDWGADRTIRGRALAELLTLAGSIGPPTVRQIVIEGARVSGTVDLSHTEVATPVRFVRCIFEDNVRLSLARMRTLQFNTCVLTSVNAAGASFDGLLEVTQSEVRRGISLDSARVSHVVKLSGSTISAKTTAALNADGLAVGGNMLLRDQFHSVGELRLVGARIGGQLVCTGGRFENPEGIALDACAAEISGSTFLNKTRDDSEGFYATGMVQLIGARIGGQLSCRGGRFENPGGNAINADGAEIRGDVYLDRGFHATGEVRLINAQVTGQLNCTGGQFENPERIAINADGVDIRSAAFLSDGFRAEGLVRLLGARIVGELDCSEGRFRNPDRVALAADRADIRGNARLNTGFHATGEVRLAGAQITGQLNCSGGRFDNPSGDALVIESAKIGGDVLLNKLRDDINGFRAKGVVQLVGAQIAGQLNCSGGKFDNPRSIALATVGAVIGRDALLRDGFHTSGELRMLGTRIAGQLNCSGGRLENPDGNALAADSVDVGGSIFLADGLHATGEVRLLRARIGTDLNCRSGRFDNPEGNALHADGLEVRGNALLTQGFHATGDVRMPGARIVGQLDCSGGRFDSPDGHALLADGAEIGSSVFLANGFRATGEVRLSNVHIARQLAVTNAVLSKTDGFALNLQSARADVFWIRGPGLQLCGGLALRSARFRVLADDPEALPDSLTRLDLDGCVYEQLDPDSTQDSDTSPAVANAAAAGLSLAAF